MSPRISVFGFATSSASNISSVSTPTGSPPPEPTIQAGLVCASEYIDIGTPEPRSAPGPLPRSGRSAPSAGQRSDPAIVNSQIPDIFDAHDISPRGRLLAESEVRLPLLNATRWGCPDPTPGRMLKPSHEGRGR